MKNEDVIQYYDKMAERIQCPTETRNKAKDFSQFDIEFMKKRASKQKTLLDLGSGTGLLINALVDDFKHITAVEKYQNFSKFISNSPNIEVINADLLALPIKQKTFDIISLFGVMNCFNLAEAKSIYQQAFDLLKSGGSLIVKNQMGIHEDVTVNGFSEEIGSNYFANYRHVEAEIALLQTFGFSDVCKFDIYPKEYNRWENTHFYALSASK